MIRTGNGLWRLSMRRWSLAQEEMGLTDWNTLKKGDWRKGLVANLIGARTGLSLY